MDELTQYQVIVPGEMVDIDGVVWIPAKKHEVVVDKLNQRILEICIAKLKLETDIDGHLATEPPPDGEMVLVLVQNKHRLGWMGKVDLGEEGWYSTWTIIEHPGDKITEDPTLWWRLPGIRKA